MRRTRACVPLNPWEHQGTRFRSESPWPRLPHHATRWLHSRSPSLALQLTAVHAVAGAAHMNHDAHMHGSREESLTSLALTSTRRGGPCRQERLKTGSLAPALGTTLRAPHGGDGCPPRYTRASWSEYRRGGGGGGERAGERVTRGGKSACVTGSESDARPSRGVTGGCACGACGHQHTWPHAATRGVGEAGGECDAPSRGRRGGGAGAEWGGEGGGGVGRHARCVRLRSMERDGALGSQPRVTLQDTSVDPAEALAAVPDAPGVYAIYDQAGEVQCVPTRTSLTLTPSVALTSPRGQVPRQRT